MNGELNMSFDRTVPGIGAHEVPHPLRPAAGAGTAQPAHPPTLRHARTHRPRPEPGRGLGPHTAARAEDRVFLLPLRAARPLPPLRGGIEGRRTRECCADPPADRRIVSQAGDPAPGADPALRPRRPHDPLVHRTTPRSARHHPLAQSPQGPRRPPLLGGTVQDLEIPPRVPRALPGPDCRDRLLSILLPLVPHRTSPCRPRDAHP